MWNLFWVGQPIVDIVYVTIAIQLLLIGIMVWHIPEIFRLSLSSLWAGKEKDLHTYLLRHMPFASFSILTFVQTSISGAFVTWLILRKYGICTIWEVGEFYFPLLILGVVILTLSIRLLSYRLWKWLFLPLHRLDYSSLRYILCSWFWSVSLSFCSLLFLLPCPVHICGITVLSLFLLWRIAVIIFLARDLRVAGLCQAHVFLYLCAHEILPYAYLSVAIMGGMLNSEMQEFLWQQV